MRLSSFLGFAGLATAIPASRPSYLQSLITEQDQNVPYLQKHSVPVSPWNGFVHTIDITIGTPPKKFNVSLDLSSNSFLVPLAKCVKDCDGKQLYNSTESATYIPNGSPTTGRHWDVDYVGFLSQDSVQVAGIQVENQIFEEYTIVKSWGFFGGPLERFGMLGLAPPWNSSQDKQGYQNYLSLLQSRKALTENVFSLKLPHSLKEQGELTFGGSNPDMYTGAFRNISLLPDHLLPPRWRGRWALPIKSLALNANQPMRHPTPNYTAILSSTPLFALPKAFVHNFKAAVGDPPCGRWACRIPCTQRPFLPELTFEIGDESFTVDGWDYVFEYESIKGSKRCGMMVMETEDMDIAPQTLVLGTGFLKRWYSRWDFEERKVGFAELKK